MAAGGMASYPAQSAASSGVGIQVNRRQERNPILKVVVSCLFLCEMHSFSVLKPFQGTLFLK